MKLDIRCLGVVLNKTTHQKKYQNSYNPSSVCYEYLIQRVANFLNQMQGRLEKVVVDDMSGKTQAGNDWKNLLQDEHGRLKNNKKRIIYNTWTPNKKGLDKMDYEAIGEASMTFIDSKQSFLVQIADLCAYNIMRQGKDHGGDFDAPPDDCYQGYEWIRPIMHSSPSSFSKGKITGYGAVYVR